MNHNIIIIAETGSDITMDLASQLGVILVPMHVSMGDITLDDGTFPPEKIYEYYNSTGKVPKTSASSPMDFEKVFDFIHEQYPEKKILHLAYSAVTTCSYQNALISSEDRDYVYSVDTKQVSIGQNVVVREAVKFLEEHPDCTIEEAIDFVEYIRERVHMCFIPNNLDYLRAGGRVSNAVALVGNILGLHPCIEIIDGKLLAKKKYRGSMNKVIPKLMNDFMNNYGIEKEHLYFIWSAGLDDSLKMIAENEAMKMGFKSCNWNQTGCVITTHGGPNAFGLVGITR